VAWPRPQSKGAVKIVILAGFLTVLQKNISKKQ